MKNVYASKFFTESSNQQWFFQCLKLFYVTCYKYFNDTHKLTYNYFIILSFYLNIFTVFIV